VLVCPVFKHSNRLTGTLMAAIGVYEVLSGALVGAAEKVALVVGNARYESEVGALRNAVNDSKGMAATLRALGFDVIEKQNLTRDEMIKAMVAFRTGLAEAEVGLFYYAGHGLAVGGANYLVPVKSGYEAEGVDETTRRMLAETRLFNVEQAVADMKSAGGRCHLVILDACRTTALTASGRTRDVVSRGGLAEMAPPAGSLVAFATDAGHTAFDGDGTHGLYTEELMKHLRTPGLTIEQVFKRTRASVLERSDGGQMPAEYSRLIGDDVYLAGVPSTSGAVEAQEVAVVKPEGDVDLMALAKKGEARACAVAMRARLAEVGAFVESVEPLSILLEQVKEDLKLAEAPSPSVLKSAETCALVLELLMEVVPADHERLGELTAKAYNRRGDARLLLGQAEAALADFEASLKLTDEDAYLFYNRGCALLALGREEEAKVDFERAAGPGFSQPGAKRLAGEALRRLGRKE
jgi:hypothetical protein